jgi:hypothetical protein
MLVDTAGVLDLAIERPLFRPLNAPDEMAMLWRDLGFADVEQTSLVIRMEFASFDDYWLPFTNGEGPPGHIVAKFSGAARASLINNLRRAYLANRPVVRARSPASRGRVVEQCRTKYRCTKIVIFAQAEQLPCAAWCLDRIPRMTGNGARPWRLGRPANVSWLRLLRILPGR